MSTNVTIKDVARRAGVSIATVSRAMNGKGYVKDSTRRKVEEAVRTLGYSPNHMARSLTVGSTKMIGAIIPDIANPFFPALARGLDDALTSRGYLSIICNTDGESHQEEALVNALLAKRVDGIVFASGSVVSSSLVSTATSQVPVVVIDREIAGVSCDTVTVNNYRGAYEMTSHLILGGHRRIAFISGPPGLSTSETRASGYVDCMRDNDMEPVIYPGDFKYETGYSVARDILSSGLGITAVFASNDLMALGAMRCFLDAGLLIPAQMAVGGYDDIFMASIMRPALTTVAQPAYRMGALAAEMLLERIEDPTRPTTSHRVLDPTLVVRESTEGRRVQP